VEPDDINKFIGKTVVDTYGRAIGRMVGFLTNNKQYVSTIALEMGNNEFLQYPISRFSIREKSIIFDYSWIVESNALNTAYSITFGKISALNKLYKGGEVPAEVYDEMRKQQEQLINDISERCLTLNDMLKEKLTKLNTQLKELKVFLIGFQIGHMTGEIDDKYFEMSFGYIQKMLTGILLEKKDVNKATKKISNMPSIPRKIDKQSISRKKTTRPIVLRLENES